MTRKLQELIEEFLSTYSAQVIDDRTVIRDKDMMRPLLEAIAQLAEEEGRRKGLIDAITTINDADTTDSRKLDGADYISYIKQKLSFLGW